MRRRGGIAVLYVLFLAFPCVADDADSPSVSLGITVQSKELADARLMPHGAPSLKSRSCVVVSKVDPSGPSAGKLSEDNAIISIDGVATPDVAAYEKALKGLKPDSEIAIKGLYLAPAPLGAKKWVPGSVVVKVAVAATPQEAKVRDDSGSRRELADESPRNPDADYPESLGDRPSLPGKDSSAVVAGVDRSPAVADTKASRKLEENIFRFARGSEPDPGWAMQASHRLLRAQHLAPASPLGRMLDAYQRGVGEWTNADGTTERMSRLGMPDCDWRSKNFMKAYVEKNEDREPFVNVEREADGTRATLSPIEVAEDLLCSVSFLVIEKSPTHARAAGLDFLAVQVGLYGGKPWRLDTSPVMQPDTFVDLWSSTKNKRYTITRWVPDQPAGHMTAQTYGPLLFDVLSNEPDFMFIENVKIELSPRFRAGCRRLCEEVLALREKQGQDNPPECRMPSE